MTNDECERLGIRTPYPSLLMWIMIWPICLLVTIQTGWQRWKSR